MGFSIKAPKIKLPKIKIKAPSIKGLDPSKLVTNYLDGVGNIASSAVSQVGKVVSTPGASTLLSGAGTAFGVPGLGNLIPPQTTSAQEYVERKADFNVMPQTQNFQQPSNNKMYFIIAGVIGAVGLIIFIMKRK